MIICKKCGHQNPDGATFCAHDGAYLGWTETGEKAVEHAKAGVRLLIVPNLLEVEAGTTGCYELSVQNTGDVVDAFELQIPDVPWMSVDPPEINLFPAKSDKVRIEARPPRDPSVKAGQVRFTVRATSHADPQVTAEELAVVAVGGFNDTGASLVPVTSRGEEIGNHTVTIENRGNHPIGGGVRATDQDAALSFDIAPQTFAVEPGGTASIHLGVRPSDGRALRQEQPHRFQAEVDVTGAPPIVLDGTMIQVPAVVHRRRPWLLIASGVLAAVLLTAGGVFLYQHVKPGPNPPTPTPGSRASLYAGKWVNDNLSTTRDVPQLVITVSGDQVTVHGYGMCHPTYCDWGSTTATFTAEPFVIGQFPQAPGQTLTLVLDRAGRSLSVKDRYTTETFHKV